jgi:hypothetical protein
MEKPGHRDQHRCHLDNPAFKSSSKQGFERTFAPQEPGGNPCFAPDKTRFPLSERSEYCAFFQPDITLNNRKHYAN